jgi:hypothetical protein
MNPEVTKIGNKLFDKVELSSQKVELALIDDLRKSAELTKSKSNSLYDSINESKKWAERSKENYANLIKQHVDFLAVVKKIEAMAKDLGIAIPFADDIAGTNSLVKSQLDYFKKEIK